MVDKFLDYISYSQKEQLFIILMLWALLYIIYFIKYRELKKSKVKDSIGCCLSFYSIWGILLIVDSIPPTVSDYVNALFLAIVFNITTFASCLMSFYTRDE
ncbi:hypothetical protein PMAL9190_01338 [Photobacterium malacitanum]|uniref:Uncharacterized protein n=1 Tax=Photobacterium malacitanum TaxID=2204294 RepID=A0A1Y6MD84_9GAMM|nr:hypothetical protein [Photobacterium malacitanum]SMY33879.1 hypothetical protein PMAL9190_01338 [Photobacterium malacitanum]